MTQSATGAAPIDPDFAEAVLRDLYTYRPKNRVVAWSIYVLFGWAGGHRFYMGHIGTGLLMLFTGGGGLVWWIVDGFLLEGMLARHAAEQDRRRRESLPPMALAFMPPLKADVLHQPPPWIAQWNAGNRSSKRLVGDLVVLLVAGLLLGTLAGGRGGEEAVFAAVAVIGITLLGGHVGRLDRVPLARGLVRWSHRVRLFYYYNRPGTPAALLLRGFSAVLLAPFRARARAEALLYIEVGAVFTLVFVTLDLMEDVAVPMVDMGLAALAPSRLVSIIFQEALMTFLLIYAFVTPIGAILNLHLLTRPTHTVPRILGLVVLLGMALGFGVIG